MSLGPLGAGVSRRRLDLLVSSMSARGRAISVGPRVVRILREGGWDVQVTVTTPDDDPTDVARAMATPTGQVGGSALVRPLVGALGGDGYISTVAQGLADTAAVLVPLPGGRGNDLCRAVGAGADPFGRARALADLGLVGAGSVGGGSDGDLPGDLAGDCAPDRPVDRAGDLPAGRVRGLDGIWVEDIDEGAPRRLVLGVISFGLEAWANIIANESRFRSGPLAYAYGALAAPLRFHQADFVAEVDGERLDMGGWALSVSNSGCIGGGIRVVPSSDPFDGELEVFHVGRMPLRAALPILARVVATRGAEDPAVDIRPARELLVTEPAGMPAMADGDRVGTIPMRLAVAPSVVDVLV